MKWFKQFSIKEKWFLIFSFIFIIYNVFPLATYYSPIPVEFICIITVIVLVILYPKTIISKPLLWLYLFLFVLFINSSLGGYIHINGVDNTVLSSSSRIIIEAAWIMPSLLMASILLELKNIDLYKAIIGGTLFLLIISFLTIIPLLEISSNILREDLENPEFLDLIPGLPNYTLMHSYVLMIPGLCLGFKLAKNKGKIIWLCILALFYFIILKTAVTTSLIISTIYLILFFGIRRYNLKHIIIFTFFFIISAYILNKLSFFLFLIDQVYPFFEGTPVEPKLVDFHNSLLQGEAQGGTIEGREGLHEISLNSFLSNPLIGGGKVGGHSTFFDILGSVGLIGFIPFIMIIISLLKTYLTLSTNLIYQFSIYSVFIIAGVFLSIKGIFGSTGWLFLSVLAPSLIIALKFNFKNYHHVKNKNFNSFRCTLE